MSEPMSQARNASRAGSQAGSGSNPQWKGTLGLAVALTVVASAAWWMEYSWKPQKEEEETLSKKIFRLKGEPVKELRITSGEKTFAFECLDEQKNLCKSGDPSKWRMTAPAEMRADDSNVNSFLSALANAQSSESIDLSEDTDEKRAQLLKDYGLGSEERAKPGFRHLEVKLASGEKRTVWIGGNHPIGDQLFTLTSTDAEKKVFLLPSYFKSHFERDLTYWRNKKVFEIDSTAVTALEVQGTKSKYRAERKDGSWQLAALDSRSQEYLPGDSESLDNLLGAAGNLTARSFAAEDKDSAEGRTALKGAKAIATLSVTLKETSQEETKDKAKEKSNQPVVLTLYERASAASNKPKGKTAGKGEVELFATSSNLKPVFEVENSVRNRLDKPFSDLRLKRMVSSMDRLAATRVSFEGAELGAAPLEFQLSSSKWKLGEKAPASDTEATLDPEKVEKLIEKLAGRQIDEFVSGKDIPAGEAEGLRVYLGTEAEPRKQQFVFWKAADKRLYGRDLLSKRAEAWKLESALKSALPWTRNVLLKPAAASDSKTPVTGTPTSSESKKPEEPKKSG